MQTIGLIGGLSWYSTVEYYRVLNETVQQRRGGHASASIALQSLDFAEVRAMQQAGDWSAAAKLLAGAGRRCQDAGADVVLICSNLMHRVADDVQAAIDVPLLHIADAIVQRARVHGWSQLVFDELTQGSVRPPSRTAYTPGSSSGWPAPGPMRSSSAVPRSASSSVPRTPHFRCWTRCAYTRKPPPTSPSAKLSEPERAVAR